MQRRRVKYYDAQPALFANVNLLSRPGMLGEYVIMPDHMHGIIVICDDRNGVSYVGANGPDPEIHCRKRSQLVR